MALPFKRGVYSILARQPDRGGCFKEHRWKMRLGKSVADRVGSVAGGGGDISVGLSQ